MTKDNKEHGTATSLFGTTRSSDENFLKNIRLVRLLLMPLPTGAKIWFFCAGCGQPLPLKGVNSFKDHGLIEGEIPEEKVLKEYALIGPGCSYCKTASEGKKMFFKKIADLIDEATQGE